MLGSRRPAALREYRRLMREELEEPYEEVPAWRQAVKGDEAFADRVFHGIGEPPVVPRGMTVERLARAVARMEGVGPEVMRRRGQGRSPSRARLITAWVGRELGRIPAAQTAKYFGRDTSTMIKGLARLEERMESDHGLRRRVQQLARQWNR